MKDHPRKFLIVEGKPEAGGYSNNPPVGGEILPVNTFQLFLVNLWWVFLLLIPLLMYFLTAKYGVGLPRRLRRALERVPVVSAR